MSKRRPRRRKRSSTTTTHQQSTDSEPNEPPPKKAKYGNYGDYRRRSDRIKTTTNYDDAQFGDDVIIDTDEDQEPSDHHMNVTSHESDVQMEDEEEDDEIQSDESTPNDEANHNNNGTNVFFASNLIRNHRTIRTILNNDELNEEELAFKAKAYQYVNDYFESNLRQSKQLWMDQKHKYETKHKENMNVLPFARGAVISHASFLNDVAQDVKKTSKYVHITGLTDDDRIDEMIEPIEIALNEETCPIPNCTPYVTVNRNHYMKDDPKLRYIPLIGADMDWDDDNDSGSDTEFEEQEDILLDYIYENLELDNEETIALFEKIFYLSFERIQHRIMALSHHKEKLLREEKKTLLLLGYDTKNKDIPIDSFSLLFCPRCMTYDCSLHGLDNPRRRERALPSDTLLSEAGNCDYFGCINKRIRDPNALASTEGNHSSSNHMIEYLLPPQYKPSVVYPQDLSECGACGDACYLNNNTINDGEHEWNYMELANLRRLLNICKKNVCQIARILNSVSCKNVYLKAIQLIPDLSPYVNETKGATKKAAPEQTQMHRREPVELHAENVTQFFGCKHDGACSAENNCSCIMNQTHCEKYCNCEMQCAQRFAGCSCDDGECRTDKCQCFRFHRECDPDRCTACQSYLTPNVFTKAIAWLKENDSEFYAKHYSIAEEEEEEEVEQEVVPKNVAIEIDGVAHVNPYKLCRNLCCTQQRKKKLWIGRSEVHGFGCFAGENILKDEYVTEYMGEMITQNEADRRGRVYDEQNISYLFNLNEEYCIDATRKGSKMKFANHSTKPNCRAKIITVNGDHRICIYANKDLQVGQELLFDYRHDNVDSAQQPHWFHHNQN